MTTALDILHQISEVQSMHKYADHLAYLDKSSQQDLAQLPAKDLALLGARLLRARGRGSSYMAKLEALLDAGLNPNAVDPHGNPLLHIAAMENLPRAVKMLLARGARINRKNSMGDTALDNAENLGRRKIVALLRSHGAK